MADLLKTPLHDLHIALGGRMIAFAGYALPVHYQQSIIKEHLHCRQFAGLFDISHMGQCLVSGKNAKKALQHLVVSDISRLTDRQQIYTVFSNSNGGVIDDIIIARDDDNYRIIMNAACKQKGFAHLSHKLPDNCTANMQDHLALLALQGPASAKLMQQLAPDAEQLPFMHTCNTHIQHIPCIISRCGYTGEDGFEISVSAQHAEALAKLILQDNKTLPVGLGARDTLRLEAGLCLYGQELNESISPIAAGLKWICHNKTQDFPGAAILQQQCIQGTSTKRIGLIVSDKAILRNGTSLYDKHGDNIGLVSSGSFSPSLQKPIAQAFVPSDYLDQHVYAEVRKRKIIAEVTPLPFIAHRYHRK